MAAVITTSSSAQPKNNINTSISQSAWTDNAKDTVIKNISLAEIQNAVSKLATYASKVNNCGNCLNYTIKSTSCQSTTCQSTTCQSTTCQRCQSCQSTTCQTCQRQCSGATHCNCDSNCDRTL